jgi:hypothetical protein
MITNIKSRRVVLKHSEQKVSNISFILPWKMQKIVTHMQVKARRTSHQPCLTKVAKELKASGIPSTVLYTSQYFSDVIKFGWLQPQKDGSVMLGMPCPDDTIIPAFPVEQTGLWVLEALNNPSKWIGTSSTSNDNVSRDDMQACTEIDSLESMAKTLSEVSGKVVHTRHMTDEEFLSEKNQQETTLEVWKQFKVFYDK